MLLLRWSGGSLRSQLLLRTVILLVDGGGQGRMSLHQLELLRLQRLRLLPNLLLLLIRVENFAEVLGHEHEATFVGLIHLLVSNPRQNLEQHRG